MGYFVVVNRHLTREYDFYVGRPHILGNPYRVEKYGREMAIRLYAHWLEREMMNGNRAVIQALDEIREHYLANDETVLACWCTPHLCHAQEVANAVQHMLDREQMWDTG